MLLLTPFFFERYKYTTPTMQTKKKKNIFKNGCTKKESDCCLVTVPLTQPTVNFSPDES
jgi:hypothetical protein